MSSVPGNSETDSGNQAAPEPGGTSRLPQACKQPAPRWTTIAGAAVTALVTLCFFLLYWNRFLGLRSGDGGFTAGLFYLKGILPYRDFYYPVPPLFILRSAAVLAIFGKLPIVLRGFAVFERVILALLVYGWLARFFRAKDAALAALVTTILSACDYADPLSSYNHFTIMLAVASGFAASYALDDGRRSLAGVGALAGILSLLCLASKQTIGLGVTVAIPVAVALCLIRLDGVPKALRFLLGFVAGWLVTAAALLGWMSHTGILRTFLTQAFVTGPAAKASHPGDYVERSFVLLEGYWWAALIALAVLAIAWLSLRRGGEAEQIDSTEESLKGILLVLLIGLVAIAAATLVTWPMLGFVPNLPAKPAIYVSLVGSSLLTFYYLWQFLGGALSRRQSQFALFAAIGFIAAFMTSLSFPAFEAMIIPGLALILAVLLNDLQGWQRWVLYALCGAMIFCTAAFKEGMPFGFNGWYEPPVNTAATRSSLPVLRGFLLPASTVDFADSTLRIIQQNSTPQDTIFSYPEFGFFYGASERRPATFSGSHNLDVVPDSFAREEAQRLLRMRPAVLIYGPRPEILQADEMIWRNGKPSGQRDLIAAVETLATEYRLVRVFRLYPVGNPVYVFVRPNPEGIPPQPPPAN